MLKTGDKVKCVDMTPPKQGWGLFKELPTEGNEYTVRRCYQWDNTWGVLLNEIKNPSIYIEILQGRAEVGFGIWRFQKINNSPNKVVINSELELLV